MKSTTETQPGTRGPFSSSTLLEVPLCPRSCLVALGSELWTHPFRGEGTVTQSSGSRSPRKQIKQPEIKIRCTADFWRLSALSAPAWTERGERQRLPRRGLCTQNRMKQFYSQRSSSQTLQPFPPGVLSRLILRHGGNLSKPPAASSLHLPAPVVAVTMAINDSADGEGRREMWRLDCLCASHGPKSSASFIFIFF